MGGEGQNSGSSWRVGKTVKLYINRNTSRETVKSLQAIPVTALIARPELKAQGAMGTTVIAHTGGG